MNKRETEALARLLESGSTQKGEASSELRALETLAHSLAAVTPAPDQAFKSELRAMLLQEAREQHAAPRILPRVRARAANLAEAWRYSTRVAAATLAAAMTFSGGGAVAVAAERALPSDSLYGVKLALDEARAAVRFDAVAKGNVHLSNASERIDDAESAVALGDVDGAGRALDQSSSSARKGAKALLSGYEARGDSQIVRDLSEFAQVQASRVRVLERRLHGKALVAAKGSLVTLARIEARLVAIGGACGDCPAQAAPSSGEAFDFTDIPPADEEFQACPCDEGEEAPRRSRSRRRDRAEPQPTESAQPTDPGDNDDDDEGGSSLPEPVGTVVNEILEGIGRAQEGIAATPPTGGLGLPSGAELPVTLP